MANSNPDLMGRIDQAFTVFANTYPGYAPTLVHNGIEVYPGWDGLWMGDLIQPERVIGFAPDTQFEGCYAMWVEEQDENIQATSLANTGLQLELAEQGILTKVISLG